MKARLLVNRACVLGVFDAMLVWPIAARAQAKGGILSGYAFLAGGGASGP
jgi:hypothetical protein